MLYGEGKLSNEINQEAGLLLLTLGACRKKVLWGSSQIVGKAGQYLKKMSTK